MMRLWWPATEQERHMACQIASCSRPTVSVLDGGASGLLRMCSIHTDDDAVKQERQDIKP